MLAVEGRPAQRGSVGEGIGCVGLVGGVDPGRRLHCYLGNGCVVLDSRGAVDGKGPDKMDALTAKGLEV
jgi:hypothetical protein